MGVGEIWLVRLFFAVLGLCVFGQDMVASYTKCLCWGFVVGDGKLRVGLDSWGFGLGVGFGGRGGGEGRRGEGGKHGEKEDGKGGREFAMGRRQGEGNAGGDGVR